MNAVQEQLFKKLKRIFVTPYPVGVERELKMVLPYILESGTVGVLFHLVSGGVKREFFVTDVGLVLENINFKTDAADVADMTASSWKYTDDSKHLEETLKAPPPPIPNLTFGLVPRAVRIAGGGGMVVKRSNNGKVHTLAYEQRENALIVSTHSSTISETLFEQLRKEAITNFEKMSDVVIEGEDTP